MKVHRKATAVGRPAGREVMMSIRTGQFGPIDDDLPAPEEFQLILDDQPLPPQEDDLPLEADTADALDQRVAVDDPDS